MVTQHFGMTTGATASATLRMCTCVVGTDHSKMWVKLTRCVGLTHFVSAADLVCFSQNVSVCTQHVTHPINMAKTFCTPHPMVMDVSHSCGSHKMFFKSVWRMSSGMVSNCLTSTVGLLLGAPLPLPHVISQCLWGHGLLPTSEQMHKPSGARCSGRRTAGAPGDSRAG